MRFIIKVKYILQKKFLKQVLCLTLVLACFTALFGCGDGDNSATEGDKGNLVRANENAVYAYVNAGYENDILADVEGSFSSLSFQKVYVAEKNTNEWTPLILLFVLNDGGELTQKELVNLLEEDERINHASAVRDLPFETVDTRYIEKEKDTISVGETLQLTLIGNIDYYVQPFDFKGFFVKPATVKKYNVKSFPGIELKSITEYEEGWLYLELKEEGYFNVVNACDKVARLSEIESAEKDKRNVVSIINPIWQASDETIASIETNLEKYTSVMLTGLKQGKVTIDYDGVKCEITVQ